MRKMVYVSLFIYILAVASICLSPPWKAQAESVTRSFRGHRYDIESYRLPNAPLWNRKLALYRYFARGEGPRPWEGPGPDTSPLKVDYRRLAQQLVMITAMFGGILAIVAARLGRLGRAKDI